MRNLIKTTRSAYTTAKSNRTLICPNVAMITDENNKIEYLANNPSADIGIASWEGGVRKFYSLAEWNALETKPTALGVYVFTEDSQFIIHASSGANMYKYTDTEYLIPGVSAKSGLNDFAGKTNTAAILDALNNELIANAPAAVWANGLSFEDGTAAYVAAAGQVNLIGLNLTDINNCRTALSQSTFTFANGKTWYTSTQANASQAYVWFNGSGYFNRPKSTSSSQFALCDI